MILLVDNQDSFTRNLAHLIALAWEEPVVLDALLAVESLQNGLPRAVVLSPGPGRPEEHAELQACLDLALGRIPLLGICLGFQAIGLRAGCRLVEAPRPVHGQVWPLLHEHTGLLADAPASFGVMRYHSLMLDTTHALPGFRQDARCEDGVPMAFSWEERRAWGLQFHPESFASESGTTLIQAFARLVEVRPSTA